MPDFSVQGEEQWIPPYPISVAGLNCIPELTYFGAVTGRAPTAGRGIFIPFIVQEPFTAITITLVTATGTSGNLDGGIYRLDGTRIVSSGSTPLNAVATNPQIMDIVDTLLPRGYYYMAISTDVSTGTWAASGPSVVTQQCYGIQEVTSGAFPLPSIATLVKPIVAFVPYMIVQARVI